jgi:dihydrofolate synthase/folylpolyglutamate synthase
MDYPETVEYLFSQLPMFQRVGAPAYKADLSRTIALCDLLGNPEKKFKCIHVAGTNGKGSVASALASIFQECGYKTGLYTSPHLKDYRERIKINGQKIPQDFVVGFVENYQQKAPDDLKPSFFELTTAMGFAYFAAEKVDIAILEVGLGGRLDSTNVVAPEISVITSVSADHQQFLGDTIEEIAAEKGGIIKESTPVVIGKNDEIVLNTLTNIAGSLKAAVHLVTDRLHIIQTELEGSYQRENMRTVAKTLKVARDLGWQLPEEKVKAGALKVVENTGLRGRWETLDLQPKVITDVGHNLDGVKQVVDMLRRETYVRLHIVWGMVGDKDSKSILAQLPTSATYYWCRPDVPRGKNARELSSEALKFSLEGKVYPSVKVALASAKNDAARNDLIFVGGSVFVVAEVL